jgi:hypothetical protein
LRRWYGAGYNEGRIGALDAPTASTIHLFEGRIVGHYRLEVPTVAQTSSDTCWHSAALMVWYYSQKMTGKSGPMNTLREDFEANRPINDWPSLAKLVGLAEIGKDQEYTSDELMNLLVKHGPLWAAGNWYGVGHCIVITGVDGGSVYLNDPDGGV